MRALSAATLAALSASHVVQVQLLLFEFSSGDLAVNNSNWDIEYDGVTYLGAYGLGQVSAVKDAPGEVQGIRLTLDAGTPVLVTLALDDADEVQGTALTIRTGVFDVATHTILDAPIDWLGKLDTMALEEDGRQAIIAVSAESSAVDLMRGSPATYSDADQQDAYPGDRAFEYVVAQQDKPITWPSRGWFLK